MNRPDLQYLFRLNRIARRLTLFVWLCIQLLLAGCSSDNPVDSELPGQPTFTWTQVYPSLSAEPLHDVAIADDSLVFTCGNTGTLLRSTDNGVSWSSIRTNTRAALWGIDLYGQYGLIVGDSGTVMSTADHGLTWQTTSYTAMEQFRAVSITGNATAWAVTQDGKVTRTIDSGDSWSMNYHAAGGGYRQILFLDDQTGWILADSSLMYTDNGGGSWTDFQIDTLDFMPEPYFSSISQADDGTLSIFGTGVVYYHRYDFVLVSYDDGGSWQYHEIWGGYGLPLACGWTDAQSGFLVAGSGYIVKTDDSGYTWELTSAEIVGRPAAIDCHHDRIVVVSGDAAIRYSTDNGSSWHFSNPREEGDINGVVFLSDSLGIKFDQLAARRTLDGGLTWNVVWNGMAKSADLLPGDTIIALMSNGLLMSVDSGLTWTNISGPPLGSIAGMDFVSSKSGWVLAGHAFAKTSNGGADWTTVLTGALAWVTLEVRHIDTIWLGSNDGRIRRTTDGGASWSDFQLPLSESILDFHFTNADTGWCVGTRGLLAMTENRGLNWTVLPTFTTVNLNEVCFSNDSIGVIVGDFGTIHATANGGHTWTTHLLPTSGILKTISARSESTFYVGGDAGVLYRVDYR